ncbi:MAG: UTP--glucose-1-phosphate uridylyltransferase, partial [Candidatus Omnitrophica bacterium]|nr:UTP--glucose-1-phosphate uridylyltransferase [Candidatus Omnitrophota bacterium]
EAIDTLIVPFWNDDDLGRDLRIALEDFNDNDLAKAKKALFDKLSQINKAAAKKTIDAQLENKAKGFLANAQTTEGVRTVRKQKATPEAIDTLIVPFWNDDDLGRDLRIALEDFNDNDLAKAKKALFDKLSAMNKAKAKINIISVAYNFYKNNLAHIRQEQQAISQLGTQLAQARQTPNNPHIPQLESDIQDKKNKLWQRAVQQLELNVDTQNAWLDLNDSHLDKAAEAFYQRVLQISAGEAKVQINKFMSPDNNRVSDFIQSQNTVLREASIELRELEQQLAQAKKAQDQNLTQQLWQSAIEQQLLNDDMQQLFIDANAGNLQVAKLGFYQRLEELRYKTIAKTMLDFTAISDEVEALAKQFAEEIKRGIFTVWSVERKLREEEESLSHSTVSLFMVMMRQAEEELPAQASVQNRVAQVQLVANDYGISQRGPPWLNEILTAVISLIQSPQHQPDFKEPSINEPGISKQLKERIYDEIREELQKQQCASSPSEDTASFKLQAISQNSSSPLFARTRLEWRIGKEIPENISYAEVGFLLTIKNHRVLRLIVDSWSIIRTIPNPAWDQYLLAMSSFEQSSASRNAMMAEMGITEQDVDWAGVPPVLPIQPSKYLTYPDKEWKEFINSLTPENVEEKIEELMRQQGISSPISEAEAQQRVDEFISAHPRWKEDTHGTFKAWQDAYLTKDWQLISLGLSRKNRQDEAQKKIVYMGQDENFRRILIMSLLSEQYLEQQLPLVVGPIEKRCGARLELSRIIGRTIPDSSSIAGPSWLQDGRMIYGLFVNLADMVDSAVIARDLRPSVLRHEAGHWILDSAALVYGRAMGLDSSRDPQSRLPLPRPLSGDWPDDLFSSGIEHPYLNGLRFDVSRAQELCRNLLNRPENRGLSSLKHKVGKVLAELVAEWVNLQFSTGEERQTEAILFLNLLISNRIGITNQLWNVSRRTLNAATRQAVIRFFHVSETDRLLRRVRWTLFWRHSLRTIDRLTEMFEDFLSGLSWKKQAATSSTPLEGASSPLFSDFREFLRTGKTKAQREQEENERRMALYSVTIGGYTFIIEDDKVRTVVQQNAGIIEKAFMENLAIESRHITGTEYYSVDGSYGGITSRDVDRVETNNIFVGNKTLSEMGLFDHVDDPSIDPDYSGWDTIRTEYTYTIVQELNITKLRDYIRTLTPENAAQKIEELKMQQGISSPISDEELRQKLESDYSQELVEFLLSLDENVTKIVAENWNVIKRNHKEAIEETTAEWEAWSNEVSMNWPSYMDGCDYMQIAAAQSSDAWIPIASDYDWKAQPMPVEPEKYVTRYVLSEQWKTFIRSITPENAAAKIEELKRLQGASSPIEKATGYRLQAISQNSSSPLFSDFAEEKDKAFIERIKQELKGLLQGFLPGEAIARLEQRIQEVSGKISELEHQWELIDTREIQGEYVPHYDDYKKVTYETYTNRVTGETVTIEQGAEELTVEIADLKKEKQILEKVRAGLLEAFGQDSERSASPISEADARARIEEKLAAQGLSDKAYLTNDSHIQEALRIMQEGYDFTTRYEPERSHIDDGGYEYIRNWLDYLGRIGDISQTVEPEPEGHEVIDSHERIEIIKTTPLEGASSPDSQDQRPNDVIRVTWEARRGMRDALIVGSSAVVDRELLLAGMTNSLTYIYREPAVDNHSPRAPPVVSSPATIEVSYGITGGTGAVGTQLIRYLLSQPSTKSIYALTRKTDESSLRKLAASHPKIHIIQGDLKDVVSLKQLVAVSDVVFHLGGWSGLGQVSEVDALSVNSFATAILTEFARATNTRIVFASTVHFYQLGKIKEGLVRESDLQLPQDLTTLLDRHYQIIKQILLPDSSLSDIAERYRSALEPFPPSLSKGAMLYSLSKLLGEKFVMDYRSGLILRFSNVYGPGDETERAVPAFMKKMVSAQPGEIITFIPGRQNSFIYVGDLVRMLATAAIIPISEENKVLFATNPVSVTQEELFLSIKAITDSQANISAMSIERMAELKLAVPPAIRFDTTLMEQWLGLKVAQLTPLVRGLDNTKNWLLNKSVQDKWAIEVDGASSSVVGEEIADAEGKINGWYITAAHFGITPENFAVQFEKKRMAKGEFLSWREDWQLQELIFVLEGGLEATVFGKVNEEETPVFEGVLEKYDAFTTLGVKWTVQANQDSIVVIIRQTPAANLSIDRKRPLDQTDPRPLKPIHPEYHQLFVDDDGLAAIYLNGKLTPTVLGVGSHGSLPLGMEVKLVMQEIEDKHAGKPHVHNPLEQPKVEVLFNRGGEIIVMLYEIVQREGKTYGVEVGRKALHEGDVIISLAGHNAIFTGEGLNIMFASVGGPFLGKTNLEESAGTSSPSQQREISPEAEKLATLLTSDSYNSDMQIRQEAIRILNKIVGLQGEVSEGTLRNTTNVLRTLLLSPVARSEEIVRKNNLSSEGLLEAYRLISSVSDLHYILINRSGFRGVAGEVEYQLKHVDYLEYMFGESEVVYPLIVEFHPGEWCPYRCVFCYTNHDIRCPFKYQDRKYGRKPLTPGKARELVREFKQGGTEDIWVSGGLEPLASEVAWQVLDEANRLGMNTKLYTDGQLLRGEIVRTAVESKWVRFSVSAVTEQMFQAVHRPMNEIFTLARVEENIKELVARKKSLGSKVVIGISYLVIPFPENYKDIIGAADWAYSLGVDFFAVRVDMAGITRPFNKEETTEILRQIGVIKENQRCAKYSNDQINMSLDLRGMSERDLVGEDRFLTGMQRAKTCQVRMSKMVINPFGIGFLCDYIEHPVNAKPEFEVGDFSQEGVEAVLRKSKQTQHNPEICNNCGIRCLIHEQIVNTILEKLRQDRDFGVSLEDQPFVTSSSPSESSKIEELELKKLELEKALSQYMYFDPDTATAGFTVLYYTDRGGAISIARALQKVKEQIAALEIETGISSLADSRIEVLKKEIEFLVLRDVLRRADLMLIFGNIDPQTAQAAAEIYNQGYVQGTFDRDSNPVHVAISGKWGRWTAGRANDREPDKTEAQIFYEIMTGMPYNVPDSVFVLEHKAQDTLSNIMFLLNEHFIPRGILRKDLLTQSGRESWLVIAVAHPIIQRRTWGTLELVFKQPENLQHFGKIEFINYAPFVPDVQNMSDMQVVDWGEKAWGELKRFIEYVSFGLNNPGKGGLDLGVARPSMALELLKEAFAVSLIPQGLTLLQAQAEIERLSIMNGEINEMIRGASSSLEEAAGYRPEGHGLASNSQSHKPQAAGLNSSRIEELEIIAALVASGQIVWDVRENRPMTTGELLAEAGIIDMPWNESLTGPATTEEAIIFGLRRKGLELGTNEEGTGRTSSPLENITGYRLQAISQNSSSPLFSDFAEEKDKAFIERIKQELKGLLQGFLPGEAIARLEQRIQEVSGKISELEHQWELIDTREIQGEYVPHYDDYKKVTYETYTNRVTGETVTIEQGAEELTAEIADLKKEKQILEKVRTGLLEAFGQDSERSASPISEADARARIEEKLAAQGLSDKAYLINDSIIQDAVTAVKTKGDFYIVYTPEQTPDVTDDSANEILSGIDAYFSYYHPTVDPAFALAGLTGQYKESNPEKLEIVAISKGASSPIQIDYRTITQDNLPIFWNNLKVLSKDGEFGRYLDAVYVKRSTSPQFHSDITTGKVEGVDIYIGKHASEAELQRDGWAVSRINISARSLKPGFYPWLPSLHRLIKGETLRYGFSGIDSNQDLHHYLSVLKFLEFPVKRIRIINNGTFDRREVYRRELAGRFTSMPYAIIGLSMVIDPAIKILQKNGWVIKKETHDTTHRYIVLERGNVAIVVAYIDAMAGDATAVFMDELYAQGVRNFVFWGTTGGLKEGQQYFDSIIPTSLYHMDSEEVLSVPTDRVRFSAEPNQLYGALLNDYTLFFPVTAHIAELKHRYDEDMDFVSVEMELYRIVEWMQSHSDAKLDAYLNISDSAKHNYALLPKLEREKIFTNAINVRTQEIMLRMEEHAASSPSIREQIETKLAMGYVGQYAHLITAAHEIEAERLLETDGDFGVYVGDGRASWGGVELGSPSIGISGDAEATTTSLEPQLFIVKIGASSPISDEELRQELGSNYSSEIAALLQSTDGIVARAVIENIDILQRHFTELGLRWQPVYDGVYNLAYTEGSTFDAAQFSAFISSLTPENAAQKIEELRQQATSSPVSYLVAGAPSVIRLPDDGTQATFIIGHNPQSTSSSPLFSMPHLKVLARYFDRYNEADDLDMILYTMKILRDVESVSLEPVKVAEAMLSYIEEILAQSRPSLIAWGIAKALGKVDAAVIPLITARFNEVITTGDEAFARFIAVSLGEFGPLAQGSTDDLIDGLSRAKERMLQREIISALAKIDREAGAKRNDYALQQEIVEAREFAKHSGNLWDYTSEQSELVTCARSSRLDVIARVVLRRMPATMTSDDIDALRAKLLSDVHNFDQPIEPNSLTKLRSALTERHNVDALTQRIILELQRCPINLYDLGLSLRGTLQDVFGEMKKQFKRVRYENIARAAIADLALTHGIERTDMLSATEALFLHYAERRRVNEGDRTVYFIRDALTKLGVSRKAEWIKALIQMRRFILIPDTERKGYFAYYWYEEAGASSSLEEAVSYKPQAAGLNSSRIEELKIIAALVASGQIVWDVRENRPMTTGELLAEAGIIDMPWNESLTGPATTEEAIIFGLRRKGLELGTNEEGTGRTSSPALLSHKQANTSFICVNCAKEVLPLDGGYRNHCPNCLCSLHLDKEFPGDRASDCKGVLIPKAIELDARKGWMIIYVCDTCGAQRRNKAAKDDNWDVLLKLSNPIGAKENAASPLMGNAASYRLQATSLMISSPLECTSYVKPIKEAKDKINGNVPLSAALPASSKLFRFLLMASLLITGCAGKETPLAEKEASRATVTSVGEKSDIEEIMSMPGVVRSSAFESIIATALKEGATKKSIKEDLNSFLIDGRYVQKYWDGTRAILRFKGALRYVEPQGETKEMVEPWYDAAVSKVTEEIKKYGRSLNKPELMMFYIQFDDGNMEEPLGFYEAFHNRICLVNGHISFFKTRNPAQILTHELLHANSFYSPSSFFAEGMTELIAWELSGVAPDRLRAERGYSYADNVDFICRLISLNPKIEEALKKVYFSGDSSEIEKLIGVDNWREICRLTINMGKVIRLENGTISEYEKFLEELNSLPDRMLDLKHNKARPSAISGHGLAVDRERASSPATPSDQRTRVPVTSKNDHSRTLNANCYPLDANMVSSAVVDRESLLAGMTKRIADAIGRLINTPEVLSRHNGRGPSAGNKTAVSSPSSAVTQRKSSPDIFNLTRLEGEAVGEPHSYTIRVKKSQADVNVVFPDDFPFSEEPRGNIRQGIRDLRVRYPDYFDSHITDTDIAVEFRDNLSTLARHEQGRLLLSWSITRRGPPVDREILQINIFDEFQHLMFFRRMLGSAAFNEPDINLQHQVVVEYIRSTPELLRATLDTAYASVHLGKNFGISVSKTHEDALERGMGPKLTSLLPITTADYILLRNHIRERMREAADDDTLFSLFGRRRLLVQQGDRAMPAFEEFINREPDAAKRNFYAELVNLSEKLTLSGFWKRAAPEQDFDVVVCPQLRPIRFAGDIYLHLTSRQRQQGYLDLGDLMVLAELYRLLPDESRKVLLDITKECIRHQFEHIVVSNENNVGVFEEERLVKRGNLLGVGEKLHRMVDYLRKAEVSLSDAPNVLQEINAYIHRASFDANLQEFPTHVQAFSVQTHLEMVRKILDIRDTTLSHPLVIRAYDRSARASLGYVFAQGDDLTKSEARRLLQRCPDTQYTDNGEEQLVYQAMVRLGKVSSKKQEKLRTLDDVEPLPEIPAMPVEPGQTVSFVVSNERVRGIRNYIEHRRGEIEAIFTRAGLDMHVDGLLQIVQELQQQAKSANNLVTVEYTQLQALGIALLPMFAYGKPNSWLSNRWATIGTEEISKGTGIIPLFGGRSINEITATAIQHLRSKYGVACPFYIMTSPFTEQEVREDFSGKDKNNYGLDPAPIFYSQNGRHRRFSELDYAFLNTGREKLDLSPDGHFGFILWLFLSGWLYRLIKDQKFIYAGSNVGNLAALPEPVLMSMFYLSGRAALCEVCQVAQQDAGRMGLLVNFKEGRQGLGQPRLQLVDPFEMSQGVSNLAVSKTEKYRKYLGLGNTNNWLFWLPGLANMFGVSMQELAALDTALADLEKIEREQPVASNDTLQARQAVEELTRKMANKITSRIPLLIDMKDGIGRLVRILGQITTLLPSTFFVKVPGREAGALSRFEDFKENIANIKRLRQRCLDAGDRTGVTAATNRVVEIMESQGRLESLLAGRTRFVNPSREAPRGIYYTSGVHPTTKKIRQRVDWELAMMAKELGMGIDKGHLPQILASNERYLSEIANLLSLGVPDPFNSKIRTSADDPIRKPVDRVLRIGIYPIAGSPPHWMHMIGGAAAMAELALDCIIYIVQGDDPRKLDLPPWQIRHPMTIELIKIYEPFFHYSSIAVGTNFDGETNIFRILQLNPNQRAIVYYIVGGDHYNRWAPRQGEIVTGEGEQQKKTKIIAPDNTILRGTPQMMEWLAQHSGLDPQVYPKPDTIQKLEDNLANGIYDFDRNMHKVSVVFLEREQLGETITSSLDIHFVHGMPFEVSATIVRDCFTKRRPMEDVDILPYTAFKYCKEHKLYGASSPLAGSLASSLADSNQSISSPNQLLKLNTQRLFVIGDLHTDAAALATIMSVIPPESILSGRTQVVFLG